MFLVCSHLEGGTYSGQVQRGGVPTLARGYIPWLGPDRGHLPWLGGTVQITLFHTHHPLHTLQKKCKNTTQ